MSQKVELREAYVAVQAEPCKDITNKLTRMLSDQESFFFTKGEGYPIEAKAVSLEDFAKKIEKIDSQSLFFHFYRGDFERWVRNSIGDPVLALKLHSGETILEGEDLRRFIAKQIKTRLDQICGISFEAKVKIG